MISEKEILLHVKALFWGLKKDSIHYDLKKVLNCLDNTHLLNELDFPQGLHLNLKYLLKNLNESSHKILHAALCRLPESKITGSVDNKNVTIGQYVTLKLTENGKSSEKFGVVVFINNECVALYYDGHKNLQRINLQTDAFNILSGLTIP